MLVRKLLLLAACFGYGSAVHAAEPFEAFLEKHCIRCHGPQKESGDIRLDKLSRDFKLGRDSHHWAEALDKVNSGEMPPKKEPQPTQKEISEFVTSLDARLKEGRAARMAARPAVAHYRLSRREYQNSVYDLLGVRYDPTKPGELNEDTLWHGFERIGSELSLSASHVDRYYRAAGLVLDRAFPVTSGEARKVRKTAAELRYNGGKAQQEALDRFGIKRPLRHLLYPGNVHHALSPNWFGKVGPEHSGLYKVRIQASGIRPVGGQTAHLSIGKRTGEETVDGLIEFDITAPEDSPQVHEFEVFLEMPMSLDFCVAATWAKGSIRVEVLTRDWQPIAGFTVAESREIQGDALDHPVRWSDNADLGKLLGQEIRLKFHMTRARLHAMTMSDHERRLGLVEAEYRSDPAGDSAPRQN